MNSILATFLSPLVYIISEHITPLFNYPIMIIILVIYYVTIPSTVISPLPLEICELLSAGDCRAKARGHANGEKCEHLRLLIGRY